MIYMSVYIFQEYILSEIDTLHGRLIVLISLNPICGFDTLFIVAFHLFRMSSVECFHIPFHFDVALSVSSQLDREVEKKQV